MVTYTQQEWEDDITDVKNRMNMLHSQSTHDERAIRKLHRFISTEFEALYEKYQDENIHRFSEELLNIIDELHNDELHYEFTEYEMGHIR